jgi:purine nucleoside phosphorylase
MVEKMVGVIGGSGLYAMEGLEEVEKISLTTPFGKPSDSFAIGRLEGVKTVFCEFPSKYLCHETVGSRMDHCRQCGGIHEGNDPSR